MDKKGMHSKLSPECKTWKTQRTSSSSPNISSNSRKSRLNKKYIQTKTVENSTLNQSRNRNQKSSSNKPSSLQSRSSFSHRHLSKYHHQDNEHEFPLNENNKTTLQRPSVSRYNQTVNKKYTFSSFKSTSQNISNSDRKRPSISRYTHGANKRYTFPSCAKPTPNKSRLKNNRNRKRRNGGIKGDPLLGLDLFPVFTNDLYNVSSMDDSSENDNYDSLSEMEMDPLAALNNKCITFLSQSTTNCAVMDNFEDIQYDIKSNLNEEETKLDESMDKNQIFQSTEISKKTLCDNDGKTLYEETNIGVESDTDSDSHSGHSFLYEIEEEEDDDELRNELFVDATKRMDMMMTEMMRNYNQNTNENCAISDVDTKTNIPALPTWSNKPSPISMNSEHKDMAIPVLTKPLRKSPVSDIEAAIISQLIAIQIDSSDSERDIDSYFVSAETDNVIN